MINQYDYQHLVMVTNTFDLGVDRLFFTVRLTQTDILKNLKIQKVPFDDIYSIQSTEVPFYCFDPFYCTEKLENLMLARAASYDAALHGPLEEA